jgi:predicted molibdopterin-dependent oxidoreductase YjgC
MGLRRLQAADTTILLDGRWVPARTGESLAVALMAEGWRPFFCGMGVCFVCLVAVDGVAGRRACVEPVRPGMQVDTRQAQGWSRARG